MLWAVNNVPSLFEAIIFHLADLNDLITYIFTHSIPQHQVILQYKDWSYLKGKKKIEQYIKVEF